MRVITGSAGGRKLKTLEGRDVRPTGDKIKEAVFSVLQFQIEGRVFLDLFAGSGQMGIEALSRGAKKAYFVDRSLASLKVVRENIKTADLEENAVVIRQEAVAFLASVSEMFDIAYVDPPYGKGIINEVLPLLCKKMNKGGVIACECGEGEKIISEAGDFVLDRTYRYGKIAVSLLRHKEML